MTNPAADTLATVAWAEVRARDRVMRYRRAGTGRIVLVLGAAPPAEPPWAGLLGALAARARIVVPDLDAAEADGAARLRDFLEGLGATDVGVVAAGRFATVAVELALLDAGQVGRVVLLAHGPDDAAGLAGALTTPGREAAVRLRVVHLDGDDPGAAGRIAALLDGTA